MFNFPDPEFQKVGGGIKKADPEGKNGGGSILYLYVQDLEETAKVRLSSVCFCGLPALSIPLSRYNSTSFPLCGTPTT